MTTGLNTTPVTAGAVCGDVRPAWDGAPVGMLGEALALTMSPATIALLIATAFVIRLRSQWGAVAVVVLWTVLVTMVTMVDLSGVRVLAQAEGCIGQPTLFIGLVAAICVGTILYTAPATGRDSNQER